MPGTNLLLLPATTLTPLSVMTDGELLTFSHLGLGGACHQHLPANHLCLLSPPASSTPFLLGIPVPGTEYGWEMGPLYLTEITISSGQKDLSNKQIHRQRLSYTTTALPCTTSIS